MSKVHIVPHNGAWAVRVEGDPFPLRIYRTQYGAIDFGKKVAQSYFMELVIHRSNGRFREAWSYGNDPYPPRG
ncbi:MAG: DUF2188 domain-containing protein [Nostocales cyanobacterium]|nr:MAG: DUF2188 domain-containing protein [Nostocales cyanobacterium]TAF07326.1 MAG: DUF2188 domain-containing protein [Nostocales cyanobacterium]